MPTDKDYPNASFKSESYNAHIKGVAWRATDKRLLFPAIATLMQVYLMKLSGLTEELESIASFFPCEDFPTDGSLFLKTYGSVENFSTEHKFISEGRDVSEAVVESLKNFEEEVKVLLPAVSIALSREAMLLCFGSGSERTHNLVELEELVINQEQKAEELNEEVLKYYSECPCEMTTETGAMISRLFNLD